MNILIIEDDPRIADFLQRGLRAEGMRVQVARSGAEGLDQARAAWDDHRGGGETTLVILDLMLGDMSGLDLCQTLRAGQVELPILMLTALSTVEDRVTGLRLGADDYLCKPFDFEELLARIEALRRRGRALQSPARTVLRVADLELDRVTMKVTRGGKVLALTAREMALLELLMSAPGRLFSRERILANVWGVNEDPLTNIVDVYIGRLRGKVDAGQAQPLIHTQRGLGYRLEVDPAGASR
ncbi:response regulator transcription factor [Phreatobacter sp.]|uniref:response regulator transcription factor n=1 Tax=Phreatobacter sp. TaxID=1966341 RepID=UPI0022C06A89|nr:response regulator transcription factor [Phreatobacter sp.]MCZ8315631.1 response regulator transcription factor [Phreatobacter sp.]